MDPPDSSYDGPVRGTRTGLMAAGLAIAVTATAAVLTVTGDDDASVRADSTSESSSTSGDGSDDGESGRSGASSGYAEGDEYAAIQRVLDARARAIQEGDRMGFLSTLDDVDPRFVKQQLVVFDNLQRLGVAEIVYGLE